MTSADDPATSTASTASTTYHYALLGNPNTGKTTLFNRLCGLRARTGNYPGITVDARFGHTSHNGTRFEIADLPGVYGLSLNLPESRLGREVLEGRVPRAPDAAAVVVDATNLARNLVLTGEVIACGLPLVVALNMMDRARKLDIDVQELARRLGCPVVPVSARTGEGFEALMDAMCAPRPGVAPTDTDTDGITSWAADLARECAGETATGTPRATRTATDRWDAILTQPGLGLPVFALVMTALFMTIFRFAAWPMDTIDQLFGWLGGQAAALLPEGEVQGLVVDGVIGGVAGTVVFLPQIFMLFFLISLIEDTGYLARASFVVDRLIRPFGLPGQAFVPLLSSHACAIPGIMCARLIPDRRDRIATIPVAPFMSCSARLPVYVLLIGFLFRDDPWLAGLVFTGCYALGVVAALSSAFLARRTLLRGRSRPMFLELPAYKMPSLRTAFLTAFDRSMVFLKKAGTVILAICIVLWWLSTYPLSDPPDEATALRERAASLAASAPEEARHLEREADVLEGKAALSNSFAGRLGRTVEPVFEPLGYDWQISIAVLTSFAAREVFVSSLAVITGSGSDASEDPRVLETLRNATRDDRSPLLTPASAASLLIFFVLAMQCLPTLAVTRREAGGWRWALLQLGYMSLMAYVAALVTRWGLITLGVS